MSTPAEPAFVASSISAAVTAILTIAQAVPNIDKRIGRVRDIEREIGRVPGLVWWLYVFPQYLYWLLLMAITVLGLSMAGIFIYGLLPGVALPPWLKDFSGYGAYVVMAWLLVGAAMYLNLFSWISIVVARFLNPSISEDPGWPALRTLVRFNENAKPLFVSEANASAFADWLIRKAPDQKPPDRAEPPARPSGIDEFPERVGNALLAGCIVEGARGPGFPTQNWKSFYRVIEEIAVDTDQFLPATVMRYGHEDRFCVDALNELNRRLLDEAMKAADQATQAAQQDATDATKAVTALGQGGAEHLLATFRSLLQAEPATKLAERLADEQLAIAQEAEKTAKETARLTHAAAEALKDVQRAETDLRTAEREWQDAERAANQTVAGQPDAQRKQALDDARQKLETARQKQQSALQTAVTAQRAVPKSKRIYEPIPDSADLKERLNRAFGGLRDRYAGKVTSLLSTRNALMKMRTDVIARSLDELRCFQSDSIRDQFIKLLGVWGIWDPGTEKLSVPFAIRVAALLLDRGVIMTTEDVKTIAFDDERDKQVARIAESLVIDHAINWIEPKLDAHRNWLPSAAVASSGGRLRWWLTYELDLRMWNYAAQLHHDQEIPNDPGLTRWRAAQGQVKRVSKS